MKKLSLLALLFVFAFTACEKDEDMLKVLPIDQVKAPTLAAHDSIVVAASNYNDNTVFTWSAADFGAPTATEYSLYVTLDGKEPAVITSTFGDSLSVSLLAIGKALYQSKIPLDSAVDVKFHLVASIASTYEPVQSEPITVNVKVGSDVPLYPDKVYMIGKEFGDWGWNNSGVVEMTPINGQDGKFWAVRYFTANNGFKWSPIRGWDGAFGSLGENAGFTNDNDGNAVVATNGFYIVLVDYIAEKITIEQANVYGIGDCFGSWDAGKNPCTAEGSVMKLTTADEGNLRIYAAADDIDWWRMEFVILDGKIAYRGNGGDQTRVPVEAGKTVTLDFNNGTGTIE